MRRDLRKLSVTNRTLGAQTTAPANKRWFQITNLAEEGYAEIKLYGYIGNPKQSRDYWTGEMVEDDDAAGTLNEFSAALEALGDVKKIQLSIFSQGGDWSTGVGMHNLLIRHPAKKIAIIDGLCASAATYPAMACAEIRIPSNASMLAHDAENGVYGNAAALRNEAENLDNISNSVAALYAKRTGKTVEEMRAMMAEGKYLTGEQCVEMGLADTLIEPITGLAARAGSLQPTNVAELRNAPAEVLALFDMSAISNAARVPLPIAPMQTTAPAPTNAAPSTTAPAVSAAPVIETPAAPAAPVNAAPDLATQITNAVNAAVAPLQAEITRLGSLAAHNVTPQNLGGAQPIANRAEFGAMNAFQRAEFVRGGGKLTD
jgi:ATP-dependent protease ClpP protease subunit